MLSTLPVRHFCMYRKFKSWSRIYFISVGDKRFRSIDFLNHCSWSCWKNLVKTCTHRMPEYSYFFSSKQIYVEFSRSSYHGRGTIIIFILAGSRTQWNMQIIILQGQLSGRRLQPGQLYNVFWMEGVLEWSLWLSSYRSSLYLHEWTLN